MAQKEIEKILKEEQDYLYTDSETWIWKKSKTERVLDENNRKMRRKTIWPQQVWYTDDNWDSKFKRIRWDDQKEPDITDTISDFSRNVWKLYYWINYEKGYW